MPAVVIFTALLTIILVSSHRTTYKLGPSNPDATLIACNTAPATSAGEPEARHAHPWPRRTRHTWTRHSAAKD
jgi:hypothetical protein